LGSKNKVLRKFMIIGHGFGGSFFAIFGGCQSFGQIFELP
jgi:hypothetical protein